MSQTRRPQRLAAAIAVLLLCLTASSCSGSHGATTQISASTHMAITATSSKPGESGTGAAESSEEDPDRPPVSDGDNSSDARPGPADRRRDGDDGPVVAFGRPASAGESAKLAPALVRRYYAVAVPVED